MILADRQKVAELTAGLQDVKWGDHHWYHCCQVPAGFFCQYHACLRKGPFYYIPVPPKRGQFTCGNTFLHLDSKWLKRCYQIVNNLLIFSIYQPIRPSFFVAGRCLGASLAYICAQPSKEWPMPANLVCYSA